MQRRVPGEASQAWIDGSLQGPKLAEGRGGGAL